MRRSLLWTLGATVILSIAAIWSSQAPRLVSAVESGGRSGQASLAGANSVARSPETSPLPEKVPHSGIEPAKRDVFVPYQPTAASQPAPPAPAPVAASVPAVPVLPPQAPPLNVRFLGRMTTPEGKRLVYLARGDVAVAVSAGERLDDGYVVETITADTVTLLYPPLDVRVTVPLPPAPTQ